MWNINRVDAPPAIVHPQSVEDVSTLVKYPKSARLRFTIRVGGHDPQGRSIVQGLGLDHLIGAPIVNPDGVIVMADQSLLKGIRGAGDFLVSLSMSLSKCIP